MVVVINYKNLYDVISGYGILYLRKNTQLDNAQSDNIQLDNTTEDDNLGV
jgi:hypothetical protein